MLHASCCCHTLTSPLSLPEIATIFGISAKERKEKKAEEERRREKREEFEQFEAWKNKRKN